MPDLTLCQKPIWNREGSDIQLIDKYRIADIEDTNKNQFSVGVFLVYLAF